MTAADNHLNGPDPQLLADERDGQDLAVSYRAGGPNVAWRETGAEIVVLDLDASVYFGLNETAGRLWKRMSTGATRSDLLDVIKKCGADDARADQDVTHFLSALDAWGLLARA